MNHLPLTTTRPRTEKRRQQFGPNRRFGLAILLVALHGSPSVLLPNKNCFAQAFAPAIRSHVNGRPTPQRQAPFNSRNSKRHHEQQKPQAIKSTTTTTTTSTALSMSLIPLTVEDVADLISVDTAPTATQYMAYWGRTPRERYSRLVESFLVSILGMVFSYCLSFVLGGFVGTILGALFLFWGVFTPQLQAVQRNWEFLGGRALMDANGSGGAFRSSRRGLQGALFLGRLQDICVVEYAGATVEEEYDVADFSDYTMETDELEQYTGNPYLLRVRLTDQQDRQLQVHARLSEEYLDLETDMEVVCLILSKSSRFDQLAALTDIYVPAVRTYIGDYPYLHRNGVENLLAEDDEIWEALQDEVIESGSSEYEYKDKDEPEDDDDDDDDDATSRPNRDSSSWEPSNFDGYSTSSWSSWENSPTSPRQTVPVRRRGRKSAPNDDVDDYY